MINMVRITIKKTAKAEIIPKTFSRVVYSVQGCQYQVLIATGSYQVDFFGTTDTVDYFLLRRIIIQTSLFEMIEDTSWKTIAPI